MARASDSRYKGGQADVAKLVDARDLKSLGLAHAGSIPAVRTMSGAIGIEFRDRRDVRIARP